MIGFSCRWRHIAISCLGALLLAISAPLSAQARLSENDFGASVCRIFPAGGGGAVTFNRGYGCSWYSVNGRRLEQPEKIIVTAHRDADTETMARYLQYMERFMEGMQVSPFTHISTFGACEPGGPTGRKMVLTMDPALSIVHGYMVCGGHFISADIILRNDGGADAAQLFDDLMPQVVPLLIQ